MPVTPGSSAPRLTAAGSAVLVIDVQERLLAAMPDRDRLVRNVAFLLDVAAVLDVPSLATEQYPRGLGPTVPELAKRLPAERPDKVAFSCCAVPAVEAAFGPAGRPSVVLTGMEAHVCVLHTALDLIDRGVTVFVPADGVASRYAIDHEFALRRLERAGAVVTTCETVAFEWLRGADHPRFKDVSKLVQQRSAAGL